jgi:hypothetical protein
MVALFGRKLCPKTAFADVGLVRKGFWTVSERLGMAGR